jgi:hypothetical protein
VVRVDVKVPQAHEVVAVAQPAAAGVEAPAAGHAALGHDDALGAGLRDNDLCGDGVALVLDVDDGAFVEVAHAGEQHLRVPADQLRPAGQIGVEPLGDPVVQRQNSVGDCLDQPQSLQLAQHRGLLGGEVVGLGPVVGAVQFPHVLVE